VVAGDVGGRAVGGRAVALGDVGPVVGAGVEDALFTAAAATARDPRGRGEDDDQSALPHAHPRGQEERSCCFKMLDQSMALEKSRKRFSREQWAKTAAR
jgi:hypothetical protein